MRWRAEWSCCKKSYKWKAIGICSWTGKFKSLLRAMILLWFPSPKSSREVKLMKWSWGRKIGCRSNYCKARKLSSSDIVLTSRGSRVLLRNKIRLDTSLPKSLKKGKRLSWNRPKGLQLPKESPLENISKSIIFLSFPYDFHDTTAIFQRPIHLQLAHMGLQSQATTLWNLGE